MTKRQIIFRQVDSAFPQLYCLTFSFKSVDISRVTQASKRPRPVGPLLAVPNLTASKRPRPVGPLLAVPNVTAHPSAASVPTSCYLIVTL